MISTLFLGAPWFVVLALLWALVAGQPAAIQAERAVATASAVDNVRLQATVDAIPRSPTPICYYGTSYRAC